MEILVEIEELLASGLAMQCAGFFDVGDCEFRRQKCAESFDCITELVNRNSCAAA